jgi:Ca-activated chloride channel family protein
VLLTDGEENVASLETQDEIAPLHAAQWCARQGIRIHSIVAGADALDTRQVEAATQATGGRFFRARDSAAVAEVSRQLDTLEQARRRDTRTRHVEHGARLVAAAGAALVLAGMLVACGAAVAAGAWRRQRLATALRVAALAGVAAALAGPTAGREALLPTHRGDVVFALDVSRSMNAADVAPTRLGAARSELERLALSVRGERIALVPFAGAAALAVPLTSDGAAFAEQAAWCDPGAVERGGSDLGAALRVAGEALRAADSAGGAIVLLTDGEDLAASAIAEIPGLRARGIVVHAVGFGSPLGSRIERSVEEGGGFAVDGDGVPIVTALDERSLQTLCAATGGIYVAARDRASPLAELWRELPLVAADRRTQPEPRPLLPWLALAAAALLGLSSLAARKPVPLPLWLAGTLAAASCGEAPPPDLATPAWNAALSARREGDRATAEALGERAAAGDPARFEACVAFLRGLDAWERQEALSGADAIADCRTALAEWSLAARIEPDWPELRRDCERAALRLRQLEPTPVVDAPVVDERRKVAIEAPPAEIPESPPTEPVATAPEEDLATLTPLLTPLPTRALDELERTMAAREAEKREARLRERRAADAAVERDW